MSPYRYIKKVDRVLKNVMQVPPVFWVLPQKNKMFWVYGIVNYLSILPKMCWRCECVNGSVQ